jgi:hypothetical protein
MIRCWSARTFRPVATEWEYCELTEHRVPCPRGEHVIGSLSLPNDLIRLDPCELVVAAGSLATDGWAPVDVQVELNGPAPADWTSRRVRFRRAARG